MPVVFNRRVSYQDAYKRSQAEIRKCLPLAEDLGIQILIENVWNNFLLSPIETARFVDELKSPLVGVYFDVGNVLGYQQYPPHWIELLGKRIKRVHLKDYAEKFDWVGSYDFCDLLSGDMPWSETMAALRAIGYDKTCSNVGSHDDLVTGVKASWNCRHR